MEMQITKGIVEGAQKIVVYGPEGIGKSTFASKFPNPLFVDTEGSTKHLDVARTPKPTSWTMLLEQVRYVKTHPDICQTFVIDTADWAEQLALSEICAKYQKKGIEDFNYGKGYVYLSEDFGRLLNLLEDLIEIGINVVVTAHATMRKFEQPDESGAYDRWELKLKKQTAPLLKEWADMLLFANYKTYVIKESDDSKKAKARGGKRVMYTTHHSCWDAKNRQSLGEELEFDYSQIASCIMTNTAKSEEQPAEKKVEGVAVESKEKKQSPRQEPTAPQNTYDYLNPLIELMDANRILPEDIQEVVAQKGYYSKNTPIEKYDKDFVMGVLVGAWPQVYEMVMKIKEGEKGNEK